MKKMGIFIISSVIVVLIIVFCFCSKEPVKVPIENKSSKTTLKMKKDERTYAELKITNNSESDETFYAVKTNSYDIWDENYEFTDLYSSSSIIVTGEGGEPCRCFRWALLHCLYGI